MHIISQVSLIDITRIQSLAEVVFRDTYKTILSAEQMEYMMEWMYSTESLTKQLTALQHTYFIISIEGKDAGYVSFSPDEAIDGMSRFHLQKIYVLPEFQHKGLGRELLLHAEKSMLNAAEAKTICYELNVNRNNPAVLFYEHMGMTKHHEGDFHIGNGFYMNDFIMRKILNAR